MLPQQNKRILTFFIGLLMMLGLFGVLSVGALTAKPVFAQASPATNQTLLPATRQNLDQFCQVLPQGGSVGRAAFRLPGLPAQLFSVPFESQINLFWLPALLALALANIFWAVPFINIVRLIEWLLSEPFLGLFRRKRKGYGVVYESLSKKPVDLALVRLINASTGKIIATRVTNRAGQFTFIEPAGNYRLKSSKRGYVFPSKYLRGESLDDNYGAITGGETFSRDVPGTLEKNIPLDAPEDKISIKAALKRNTRQLLRVVFAYLGILLSAASLVLLWNVPALIFFALHSVLFFLFFRLSDTYFGRPWGKVFDRHTKKKLGRAVVRIIDARYKRVLETRVTDRSGLYGFLVGKNNYYLEALRPGYFPEKSADFKIKNNPGLVGQDLGLKPQSSPQADFS